MALSRRDFLKGAALATAGAGVLTGLGLSQGGTQAYADPVGSGSIGLTFDENKWVLAGESVSGRVYSYDIGGTDAFDLTFNYDASVFASVSVFAPQGATILAQHDNGAQLQVVLMVDPEVVDYNNLLTVTVVAASTAGDGSINLVAAKAAKLGGTVELTIIGDGAIIGVRPIDPVSEFTIEALSLAMTFFMVDNTSPRWPDAARFDLNADGVIDIQDFVRIANGILDAASNLRLRFRADGSFKILQVSDYQDYINATNRPNVNARTVALFNRLLDEEKPDLVVMTGDQQGGNMTADLLQEYIRQMMLPCEERKVPWMITYGNHDEDATTALAAGWDKIRQLDYYRSFPCNVNRPTMSGCVEKQGNNTSCVGDMYLFLYDAEGDTPIYNLWALDSNRYRNTTVPDRISRPVPYGSNITGTHYDWIRPAQVDWYYRTSLQIEHRYGKIPSLMFFHIPLLEWTNMWFDGERHGVTGRRGEVECPAYANPGLWAVARERGDVKGMFVGHEHDNDYIGNYHGIYLSYDASIGYATYGGEYKGGKVIELNKADLSTFTTRMIYASDYGLNQ
ncbi:MAG: metallophosphoesterase family protein [Coriobacteriia bacterium]|nr:metallophosphoesterase family protein [Coriobacteriia bacterium]